MIYPLPGEGKIRKEGQMLQIRATMRGCPSLTMISIGGHSVGLHRGVTLYGGRTTCFWLDYSAISSPPIYGSEETTITVKCGWMFRSIGSQTPNRLTKGGPRQYDALRKWGNKRDRERRR
ncbi:hypothetical protein PRIPAC_81698 [Pristionchus pacificus]|uniref:Uncharacterized protein n=1 Tax=Pristionchus pacificus TaxID=54126 RepID=A0A2A6BVU2_PRIPA|nr:hypothetical protein PRIPAC_81698 [Pristionchus pacificus]|eukprot:PDM70122.1 hypothetical protein PRIPAC_46460 [Pristionchus pacificus]